MTLNQNEKSVTKILITPILAGICAKLIWEYPSDMWWLLPAYLVVNAVVILGLERLWGEG